MENKELKILVDNYVAETKHLFSDWKKQAGTVEQIVNKVPTTFTINHRDNVFIRDGVVCPEQWFSQEVRPLFLLKEAYGGKDDWDLTDYLNSSQSAGKMWRRIAEWTNGLLHTTQSQVAPYLSCPDYGTLGNDMLKKMAVVNIKKSSGKNASNVDELRGYAAFDHARLKRQLELCDPTIIVCGYTSSALDPVMEMEVRRERNENLYYQISLNGKSVLVLDYWHPANQHPVIMNYYGLMGIYHAALNTRTRGE